MSYVDPKNTLAYQLRGRPVRQHLPLADMPVGEFADRCLAYCKDKSADAKPEHAATKFYFLNHLVHEIENRRSDYEDLGEHLEFLELYNSTVAQEGLRSVFYTFMIITREARHCKNKPDMHAGAEKSGLKVGSALNAFPDSANPKSVVNAIKNNCPTVPLERYARWLETVFDMGNFNGGYGGKPWGHVARCLRMFVSGQTTLEVFLDTVWTLAHNNGPIFNKGMLYSGYDKYALQEILDVQRAGMMPQYIAEAAKGDVTYNGHKYLFKGAKKMIKKTAACIGGDVFNLEAFVDWEQVHALGAVGHYSKYQQSTAAKKIASKGMMFTGKTKSSNPPVQQIPKSNPYAPLPSVSQDAISATNGDWSQPVTPTAEPKYEPPTMVITPTKKLVIAKSPRDKD